MIVNKTLHTSSTATGAESFSMRDSARETYIAVRLGAELPSCNVVPRKTILTTA